VEEVSLQGYHRLQKHVAVLETKRAALRLTLLQFDPKLDVDSIRGPDTWRGRFGSRRLSNAGIKKRLTLEVAHLYVP
jgi:hypothetical protein